MTDNYTMTGWAEHLAAIDQLPDRTRAKLRTLAQASAERIRSRARANLIAQQKTAARGLADGITVHEDAANHAFVIVATPPQGEPANVALWNEYGTIKMPARSFMRPAAHDEESTYRREAEAAVAELLEGLAR